jgi:hypothetical protein
MSYLDLTEQDLAFAQKELDAPHAMLGEWVLPHHFIE